MARKRVVSFVAMQVDHQATLGRDLAKFGNGPHALGHGPLEMRDAADDVDAQVEGANDGLAQFLRFGPALFCLRQNSARSLRNFSAPGRWLKS